MEVVELLYELTKATSFDNSDRIGLVKLLLKDYVTYQDWGYGDDEKIEKFLLQDLDDLKKIFQDNI